MGEKIEKNAALGNPYWRSRWWLAGDGRHPRRENAATQLSRFFRISKAKLHFKALDTVAEMLALLW